MIVTIIPQKLFLNGHLKKLKVAAYCRVSTKQDHQSNSLKVQMEQYFIENNHEPIIEKEVFDKVQEKLRKIILE